MRPLLTVVAGGVIGTLAGFFAGIFISCTWLYPTSNLCGIWGLMYTTPLGLVVGALLGWFLPGRRKSGVRP